MLTSSSGLIYKPSPSLQDRAVRRDYTGSDLAPALHYVLQSLARGLAETYASLPSARWNLVVRTICITMRYCSCKYKRNAFRPGCRAYCNCCTSPCSVAPSFSTDHRKIGISLSAILIGLTNQMLLEFDDVWWLSSIRNTIVQAFTSIGMGSVAATSIMENAPSYRLFETVVLCITEKPSTSERTD